MRNSTERAWRGWEGLFATWGEVDEVVRNAVAAGGTTYSASKDYGFMYQHGFQDLDGHIWELIYMDPSAIRKD